MKYVLFTLVTLFAAHAAHASPDHVFYCNVDEGNATKQINFRMSTDDVTAGDQEGEGVFSVATLDKAGDPNRGWQDVYTAKGKVKLKLEWSNFQMRRIGTWLALSSVSVDLGRSGKVVARITQTLDQWGSAPGEVTGTARHVNLPRGEKAECFYHYSLGPKPGISGGN
jgi:hypothetical protein